MAHLPLLDLLDCHTLPTDSIHFAKHLLALLQCSTNRLELVKEATAVAGDRKPINDFGD